MAGTTERLSAAAARRIVLAAQGFGARPASVGRRQLLGMIARLGMLQIDSVNVLTRAHYLPGFSRLGAYAPGLLDAAAWGKQPALFEYWGHEASLLPVTTQPLLRWRMARARDGLGHQRLAAFAQERADFVAQVCAEIADRGALAAAELSGAGKARGKWWGWSDGKLATEYLFASGGLAVARRRGAFERVYDLPERVLPPAVLAVATPDVAEAQRALLRIAAAAMGVATGGDMARYFRLPPAAARAGVAALVEEGTLRPVTVEGWSHPGYLATGARVPRRIGGCALLSPFDPLLWERDRCERVFGFHYRIGLYTPVHRRTHGYYVLPFLMGERIVARVDLKADRAAGVLRVLASHAEDGVDKAMVAEALTEELQAMAGWQGLGRVEIAPQGDLAPMLAGARS